MRCAVVGTPVAHSLSPAMHRAAYAELGLDWTYDAVELASQDLPAHLEGLDRTWRGLSLTMPLKRTVVGLADSLDDWAAMSGAANTLVLGDRRRLGFNTDVPGAMAAVVERLHDPVREAVVLGGGATASSVLLALAELGLERATVLVREPARASETVDVVRRHRRSPEVVVGRLDEALASGPLHGDLVVSTIPGRAQGAAVLAACAEVPRVFDVVYDPWPTPLHVAAQQSGRALVSGLDLLAHQAVLQLQVMAGRSVPVDLLRSAALRELRRRGRAEAVESAGATADMA
ncbi:shikimate dehydrogenase [Nocardioides scoriae]|uniref:Shikimate dehydrogenase n=1 Tax=Nocardioides scoriae TaxID=642780 RepID=A0A1H1N1I1_9ACTN|nr:shikimate dehydrogenase [Nocardioides scoriae]SDR92750.1 shikimate dehydrogenase [Nocardioides scoriae]